MEAQFACHQHNTAAHCIMSISSKPIVLCISEAPFKYLITRVIVTCHEHGLYVWCENAHIPPKMTEGSVAVLQRGLPNVKGKENIYIPISLHWERAYNKTFVWYPSDSHLSQKRIHHIVEISVLENALWKIDSINIARYKNCLYPEGGSPDPSSNDMRCDGIRNFFILQGIYQTKTINGHQFHQWFICSLIEFTWKVIVLYTCT